MRNLIYFMHSSPDGFVAGLNGEMDRITAYDEIDRSSRYIVIWQSDISNHGSILANSR
jgi:hypothetical protein